MAVKFDPAAYQQSVNDYLAAMGVNVAPTEEIYQTPMQEPPSQTSVLTNALAKQGVKYGVKKGLNSLLASQSPAALSTSGLGPTVGASTGVGYGAPTIGSGITGVPGLDTVVPNVASEAGTSAATAPAGAGSYLGNAASALAIAKGGYDSYKGWENGGEGLRSGATTLGAGIGGLIGGPLGAGAGAAVGNTIGYGLQGSGWKNDAALLLATGGISAPLVIARRLGFNPIHKTTRQVQQEHSQQLSKLDPNNAVWQNYLGGMRNQVANKETPFAGKYKTFDEYKNAGLEAGDLTGVYGNLKAFGPDWSKLKLDQQKKVTQGLIDAGLYASKKGEVIITDEERAKQIRDSVLKAPPVTKKK